MLIGQNPGQTEIRAGRPFVGRSGKYLDSVLLKNGIDRKSIYITSVVKHGTPRNRKPNRAEIARGMPQLIHEIQTVKPKVVLLMGKVAALIPRSGEIRYIETYHPAAAMRFPKIREKFESDVRDLKNILDGIGPGRR
jgi:uracil-DNA glycosylase